MTIKKFKNFEIINEDDVEEIEDLVNAYINNPKNFPDIEKIKDILVDITDWCFLNVSIKPTFKTILHEMKDRIRYKCYYMNINFEKEELLSELTIKLNPILKKLTEYGYKTKSTKIVGKCNILVYVIDTESLVRLDDLYDNYNKISINESDISGKVKLDMIFSFYAKNPKNFPDKERIKELLSDIGDWCYMKNYNVDFTNIIYSFDKGTLALSKKGNYKCSAMIINTKQRHSDYDPDFNGKFKEQFKNVFLRIKNCGFETRVISNLGYICIYVVDTSESLTYQEIKKSYEKYFKQKDA